MFTKIALSRIKSILYFILCTISLGMIPFKSDIIDFYMKLILK